MNSAERTATVIQEKNTLTLLSLSFFFFLSQPVGWGRRKVGRASSPLRDSVRDAFTDTPARVFAPALHPLFAKEINSRLASPRTRARTHARANHAFPSTPPSLALDTGPGSFPQTLQRTLIPAGTSVLWFFLKEENVCSVQFLSH